MPVMVVDELSSELARILPLAGASVREHWVDPVTNLPNRRRFLQQATRIALRVDAATADAANPDFIAPADLPELYPLHETLTLFMITLADARHFNEILRALGHDFADGFVRANVARLRSVLRSCVDEPVEVYHVSVLSLAFMINADDAAVLAEQLVQQFRKPLVCQDIPINNHAGIGLVPFDVRKHSGAELLRAALTAAQKSRMDRKGWSLYDKKSDNAHQRAFTLLLDFPKALTESHQLSLCFQPKIDFATGRCTKAEALLRWDHPVLGAISPGEFIPLFETTALIHSLTGWVAECAIAQLAAWRRDGLDLSLAINVSPLNFAQADFCRGLIRALDRHDLPGSHLEVELTEGALAANYDVVKDQLMLLREAGVTAAIDDFGTGFSNLSNLTRLPMNTLKLDQSLIRRMGDDPRSGKLVRNVIDMAHGLDYRVVAEGIETGEDYQQLQAWGCDEGQGYFMSRPLDGLRFARWLRDAPGPGQRGHRPVQGDGRAP
jgi:EAL domain-containing protein (putative c-di-GMP-specific phosphodiesterase class I)/GGDEF domain-containing protein